MKTVFFGTPDFAVASLDAICHSGHEVLAVVTVPDRQAGRGQKVTFSPVKQYALDHHLPLLQPERLRDEEFLSALRSLGADVFCVVAFRMLPEAVWAIPPMGTFNLHASLLPLYRGAAPINWAIIRGERETGVTTFLLNHRIDEGAILMQERTPVGPDETAGELHDRLAAIGCRLVVQTLDGLADRSLTPRPQTPVDDPDRMRAPKIFTADRVVRFDQPSAAVAAFVRGMAPYPAATFALRLADGRRAEFKLFEVSPHQAPGAVPGRLQTDQKTFLRVGTLDGFVEIRSLQMSGKRRNSIEEFLRGCDVTNSVIVD